MSTQSVQPTVVHLTQDDNTKIANLSIPQLQHQLTECWVRYEKAVKLEMAPLLYHLRAKLKKQGSRTGEGFAQWVKANLGLSLSTVNRWANDFAVEHLKKPKKNRRDADGRTSGQMNRSKPDSPPDGQLSVQLILPTEQQEQFRRAQDILGPECTQVIFDAVVNAAAAREHEQVATAVPPTKKAPAAARASSTKRRKVVIQ